MERHTQKVWQSQQSWNYEALHSHAKFTPNVGSKDLKIRIRIKRDAYDSQSYALAEGFDPDRLKWQEIVSIPYPKMVCLKISYIADDVRAKDFLEDEQTLLNEVKVLLS